MKTTAIQKFEKDLNERMEWTIETMMENEEWKEILSHLSKGKMVDLIAVVFLSTAVKEGHEQAFVNAVMALNK